MWLPSASAEVVCGLVQELQLPASTRHSNVEPGSDELKANAGVVSFEGADGPLSIVVFGAVRSIVHVKLAGDASVLPAASVARTTNACVPSPSAPVVCGLVHEAQLPPSTRHWNVDPGSDELKPNAGVVSLDGLGGLESSVVSGAVTSTVQVWPAGVPSVLPA